MMNNTTACALAAGRLDRAREIAAAHHEFGNVDRTREIEITGTIAGIDFVNPHTRLYLDVVGKTTNHASAPQATPPAIPDA